MHIIRQYPMRALVAFTLVITSVMVPLTANADTKSERDEVRRKAAAAAADVDTLQATDAQVEAALSALQANVAAEASALKRAESKAAAAEAEFESATAEVTAKEAEIGDLNDAVREVAVAAFIRPPSSNGILDSLSSDTIGEAELKQSLLEAKSSNQLDVLDQLERAREDLETARQKAESASAAAESNRNAVADKLANLEAATSEQAAVAEQVQARLDHRLAEAQSLAALDSQLSAQYTSEQNAIARQLAAQAAAARSRAPSSSGGGGGPVTINIVGDGSIVSVRGIRVHQSIADNLARLLSAADAAGVTLGGGGYRSSESQIALRRAHCGSSNYAIYQMPSSQCSPPTARPGASNHERGLAIDFTVGGMAIRSRSSAAFQWLAANAASYGFYNLPSEPWHWSVNGN